MPRRLAALSEPLCTILYDALRPAVIQLHSIDKLCELVDILKHEVRVGMVSYVCVDVHLCVRVCVHACMLVRLCMRLSGCVLLQSCASTCARSCESPPLLPLDCLPHRCTG